MTLNSLPTVSVIIPTRNRPRWLRRALDAVLNQRYAGYIECIVVFDRTEVLVPQSRFDGLRPMRTATNVRSPGLPGARNTGILLSECELVAFCDDDDEWLPNKIAVQVDELLSQSRSALCTTGAYVEYRGRTYVRLARRSEISRKELIGGSGLTALHPSSFLIGRSAMVDRIGLMDEAIPGGAGEDYDLLLRASSLHPVLAVRRPLVRVHWHDSSWFQDQWVTRIAATHYLIAKHPDFNEEPKALARLWGLIAFAYAASGDHAYARKWARRSLRLNWLQPRGYMALAISHGLVTPRTLLRMARSLGRSI